MSSLLSAADDPFSEIGAELSTHGLISSSSGNGKLVRKERQVILQHGL
jgi:hypothetical protein